MRYKFLVGLLFLLACVAAAQDRPAAKKASTDPLDATSGRQTYQQYCASCHGENAKGGGPAAEALKTPPPDLTKLAKGNGGKFPYEYVSGVVRFGKPISAHGSSDMPIWGPIFSMVDYHEMAIRKRIKNLCDYLASLQEK
ncbi:MAG TPA: cytochrome c [Candidatus Acidoferrum sp.]|nr:cytochrome c [Candidatus Acidoferrum sp.]